MNPRFIASLLLVLLSINVSQALEPDFYAFSAKTKEIDSAGTEQCVTELRAYLDKQPGWISSEKLDKETTVSPSVFTDKDYFSYVFFIDKRYDLIVVDARNPDQVKVSGLIRTEDSYGTESAKRTFNEIQIILAKHNDDLEVKEFRVREKDVDWTTPLYDLASL